MSVQIEPHGGSLHISYTSTLQPQWVHSAPSSSKQWVHGAERCLSFGRSIVTMLISARWLEGCRNDCDLGKIRSDAQGNINNCSFSSSALALATRERRCWRRRRSTQGCHCRVGPTSDELAATVFKGLSPGFSGRFPIVIFSRSLHTLSPDQRLALASKSCASILASGLVCPCFAGFAHLHATWGKCRNCHAVRASCFLMSVRHATHHMSSFSPARTVPQTQSPECRCHHQDGERWLPSPRQFFDLD